MKWVVYCVCLMNVLAQSYARQHFRRYIHGILGAPRYPEHLPRGEPILPGHTLLQPTRGMLKSAVKYPLRDIGEAAVYGNLQNLGITYGRTPYRVMYTDFRRSEDNYEEDLLLQAINDINRSNKDLSNSHALVIEIRPQPPRNTLSEYLTFTKKKNSRRNTRTKKEAKEIINKKRRLRSKKYESSYSSSDSSSSSDERNPGNPFTSHKNRYKQNWPWNHFMDGDHMNVSPHGPSFDTAGPSGAEILFGRKWWYFNQDDFKPLG